MRRTLQWWLLFGLLLCAPFTQARSHHSHEVDPISSIAVSELPAEARDTLQLIKNNGPFPYPRDGIVFGNYEHKLPELPRMRYHEYTVKTPGLKNRGARRIVCGEALACYYSGDHYRTFKRIREESR